MTVAPNLPDPPRPLPGRATLGNCGPLLGRLDDLLPCLYLAQYSARANDLRERRTDAGEGLFAIGQRTGGAPPGVLPRVGLVLPVHLCRDAVARAALSALPALVGGPRRMTLAEKRQAVQARLDVAFGGELTIVNREGFDGCFALEPGEGLFRRLHESFDHVTEVLDDPAGVVRTTRTARFRWRTYGELMEWFHRLQGSDRFGAWSALTPLFVFGNTGSLPSYSTERRARRDLRTPSEEPGRWFVIRPDVQDARVGIRLEMDKHGWARLHLSLDARTATVTLSEVFDPFGEIVAWGQEIDEGDLPVQMEIDEEGEEAVLTVLRTGTPERVLLRVTRKYADGVLLEGIVARAALAGALKAELRRFFTTEFDPQQWDLRGDAELDDDCVQVKDSVLNHAWLATTR